MRTLEFIYEDFSKIATVKEACTKPPSEDDFIRAGQLLGRSFPCEYIQFCSRFYDRHPPFWDVLRVQPFSESATGLDIVATNLELRQMYSGQLDQCVLFKNTGSGDYDCFLYTATGEFIGIGVWEQYAEEHDEQPSLLYTTWFEWFTAEMEMLQSE
jgi:hypothetical protein